MGARVRAVLGVLAVGSAVAGAITVIGVVFGVAAYASGHPHAPAPLSLFAAGVAFLLVWALIASVVAALTRFTPYSPLGRGLVVTWAALAAAGVVTFFPAVAASVLPGSPLEQSLRADGIAHRLLAAGLLLFASLVFVGTTRAARKRLPGRPDGGEQRRPDRPRTTPPRSEPPGSGAAAPPGPRRAP